MDDVQAFVKHIEELIDSYERGEISFNDLIHQVSEIYQLRDDLVDFILKNGDKFSSDSISNRLKTGRIIN